ncbi:hypothetical protein SDC9_07443 [bioreactor metagenome]|uniref:Uncharacterized protein n=1 Tax=bioreactor metagenome TaxID=1076179 RepID=A0A644T4W4_9ZZZZ|nr:hypothetical protein [Methanobrevibacter sp.]MEA4956899.1 hypothetical protein [Methanobrevibacter sp.]
MSCEGYTNQIMNKCNYDKNLQEQEADEKLYSKSPRIIKRKILNKKEIKQALEHLYKVKEYDENIVKAIGILESIGD